MRLSSLGLLLSYLAVVLLSACSGDGGGIADSEDSHTSDIKTSSCSSAGSKSSSSGKSDNDSSSAGSYSGSENGTSSAAGSSDGSSSGEDGSSGDSSDESSSSEESSSSAEPYADIAVAKIVPRGTYSCKQHRCCPTEHLNEEMLEQGIYGEALDERTNVVFPTLRVGYQNWMAVNLSISTNSCDSSGWSFSPKDVKADTICPKGWHVATYDDWKVLGLYYGNILKIENWGERSFSGPENLGLGFTDEAIRMDSHNSSLGGHYYWAGYAASASVRGDGVYVSSCSGDCYGMHARCVENYAKAVPCRGDDFDNCEYGEMMDPRDGEFYKTITLGDQTWMNESLRYTDSVATPSLKGNVYTFDSVAGHENLIAYGYAGAMDSVNTGCGYGVMCDVKKGICPDGWHLISEEEVDEMIYWEKMFSGYVHNYQTHPYMWIGVHGMDFSDYIYILGDKVRVGLTYAVWLSTTRDKNYAYVLDSFDGGFDATYSCEKNKYAHPLRCAKDREKAFYEGGVNGAFPPEEE